MSEQNQSTSAGTSKNVLDFINFPRGAIGKRGLPATRNARLPSIRNPRDLTLGGLSLGVTPKRTFAPKIPVRREKPQNSGSSSDKGKPKNADRHHDRRKDSSERGRGRGRGRPEYIQTDGIFSEGIGAAMKKPSRSRNSDDTNDGPRVPRPVVPVIKKEIQDEKSDKDVLDNLLRDDFIDDGSDEERDVQCPVYLPLNCSIGNKLNVKKDPEDLKNVLHIKKEKVEIKTEDPSPPEFSDIKPDVLVKTEPSEACELFTSEDITEDKQLLFFHFPDALGIPPQPEDNNRSQPKNSRDSTASQETPAPDSDGVKLADYPEGYIGKLQVLKSGKTRLVLGSLVLDVKMGAPFNTLQDLVSIRTGMSGGDMTVLGHVHHKLVCMPDVENLMAQCALL